MSAAMAQPSRWQWPRAPAQSRRKGHAEGGVKADQKVADEAAAIEKERRRRFANSPSARAARARLLRQVGGAGERQRSRHAEPCAKKCRKTLNNVKQAVANLGTDDGRQLVAREEDAMRATLRMSRADVKHFGAPWRSRAPPRRARRRRRRRSPHGATRSWRDEGRVDALDRRSTR
jgi:hypothetical protein